MKRKTLRINKPFFLLLVGTLIFLCLGAGFLYQETRKLQAKARALIILNDSILSVNIVLTDSIQAKSPLSKGTSIKNNLEVDK